LATAIGAATGKTGAGRKQAGKDERKEDGFHGWFSPLVALGWGAGAGVVAEVVAWVCVADGGLSGFAALASVAGFAAAFVSVAAAGAAALLSVAAGAVAVLWVAVAAFSVAGVVAVFLPASALGAVFFSVAVVRRLLCRKQMRQYALWLSQSQAWRFYCGWRFSRPY